MTDDECRDVARRMREYVDLPDDWWHETCAWYFGLDFDEDEPLRDRLKEAAKDFAGCASRISKALGGGVMSDPVKAPAHYDGAHGVACMDAMRNMVDRDLSGAVVPMSAAAVYWWGCALKYVWRAPFKNGAQDIAKAIRCLEYMAGEVAAEDD